MSERSDAVWSEQGTTPDAIEAALRELLIRVHAENDNFAPARVLNMIAFVDREWTGEIANRLRGVGRYHASRLVVLAYEPRRERLDARVMIASEATGAPGELGLLRETVVVELGDSHLDDLLTIADPLVVTDLPTLLWSPHGHHEIVAELLALSQAVLLDSVDEPDAAEALDRARALAEQAYVVDLAWLRSTPWRERVAATFDPPARRPRARRDQRRDDPPPSRLDGRRDAVRRMARLAAAVDRRPAHRRRRHARGPRGRSEPGGQDVELRLLAAPELEVPGLEGLTLETSSGGRLDLDRGPGGLHARTRDAAARNARGRSPAPRAGRPACSARASARRCCATRPTCPRSPRRARWSRDPADDLPRRRDRRRAGGRPCDPRAAASPAERGVAHLALSGGTTRGAPTSCSRRSRGAGATTEIWFADERCVGPDDHESNYRLAAESCSSRPHRPPSGCTACAASSAPRRARDAYAARARRAPRAGAARARARPVVLGIGPDGHVASLFPGASTLDAGEQATCLGVSDSPKPPPERITLSLAVLRAARGCLLLATGAGKARRRQRDARRAEPATCPRACSRRERLTVITDDAAAPRRAARVTRRGTPGGRGARARDRGGARAPRGDGVEHQRAAHRAHRHPAHRSRPRGGRGRRPPLRGWEFELVLVSPLLRARETCELCGARRARKLREDLLEWDYGDYDGLTTAQIRAERPTWNLWRDGAPGGEDAAAVGARADRVIAEAAAAGAVAVFSHGHLLRVLGARWIALAPEQGARLGLSTGALCVLGEERERRILASWNETPAAREAPGAPPSPA